MNEYPAEYQQHQATTKHAMLWTVGIIAALWFFVNHK